MAIQAGMVKTLRERTGAGMMECKKALEETQGDMEAAVLLMRKRGVLKAEKRAGHAAREGRIALVLDEQAGAAAMVEVDCETDFVAQCDDFQQYTQWLAQAALQHQPRDLEHFLGLAIEGKTPEEARHDLIGKVGENVVVRRVVFMQRQGDVLGSYQHGRRIGVLVDMQGGDMAMARDVAMHIAASRPRWLDADQVPASFLQREKDVFQAQAATSGKPEAIVAKMIEGRLRKAVEEVTLLGQPFVKQPEQTVGALLKSRGARVLAYARFEVAEEEEQAV